MTATMHYDRQAVQHARRRIMGSRNKFWKTADFDMPPSTTQRLLADLVKRGELRHVRKGLYWRGTKTPLGMAPPPTDVLASQLAEGKGFGPAGLSAANALRLSTQIPRRAEYAVLDRPPADGNGLRFVSRSARRGRAASRLSPLDVAALEVLDGWDRVIETGPEETMRRLARLLQSGTISAERLARASGTERGAARSRLRYLLERNGYHNLADKVPVSDSRTETKALEDLVAA
jgi:hypothetical protein